MLHIKAFSADKGDLVHTVLFEALFFYGFITKTAFHQRSSFYRFILTNYYIIVYYLQCYNNHIYGSDQIKNTDRCTAAFTLTDSLRQCMKKVKVVLLWILSIFFVMLSLSLLTIGILPFAGLLICAVLTNPLFINRVKIKKGITFFIILALIILSFSMVPAKEGDDNAIKMASSKRSDSGNTITEDKHDALRVLTDRASEWTDPSDSPTIDETSDKRAQETPTPAPAVAPQTLASYAPAVSSTLEKEIPTPENRSVENRPSNTDKPDAAMPKTSEQQDEIIIVSYTEVVGRNEMASIKIKGKPNTEYDCDVDTSQGHLRQRGLK